MYSTVEMLLDKSQTNCLDIFAYVQASTTTILCLDSDASCKEYYCQQNNVSVLQKLLYLNYQF